MPGGEGSPHEKEYPDKNVLYRKVLVIDSNKKDELAVLEIGSSKKGKKISDDPKDRGRSRPFIHRQFSDKKPLKIENNRLERNREDRSYDPREAKAMRAYSTGSEHVAEGTKKRNRAKLATLKRRVYPGRKTKK